MTLATSTRRPLRRNAIGGAAIGAVLALALSACGGAKVGDTATTSTAGAASSSAPATSATGSSSAAAPTAAACGTVNVANNPWVGYEADTAVVMYVLKNKLGCTVNKKDLKEEISWQGFGTGEVDVVLENWGHDDLVKKYITDQKVAVDLGPNGNQGIIGWFVPPWMAKKYPDITDSKNLNKYADMFKTSESSGKGQLLDGDPSFVTEDEALVKNLNLNFKVVYAGSEDALITAFRKAEKDQKPLIGYFYSPQWFLAEVPLVKVNLPAYTAGCDADLKKVACDYAPYVLNKVASTKFANSGSPAAAMIKKFQWTNDDQNSVAKSIAQDKMSDEEAAKKWVDANPDKVAAWLAP